MLYRFHLTQGSIELSLAFNHVGGWIVTEVTMRIIVVVFAIRNRRETERL
jgi:hypothetical protein